MDNYADIERLIGNRICGVCDQRPQIVTIKNDYENKRVILGYKCDCGVNKASLVKPISEARRRLSRMIEQTKAITKRPIDEIVSMRHIKDFLCPLATPAEAAAFLKVCEHQNLNPWLKEAYLIKYQQNKPAEIVIGIDAYINRAADHAAFKGFKYGVIVITKEGNVIDDREGEFVAPGETLLGAWAITYREGREFPKTTVNLSEYLQTRWDRDKNQHVPQALWATHPAMMIVKCALSQALRRGFPRETRIDIERVVDGVRVSIEGMQGTVIDGSARYIDTDTGDIQDAPTEPDSAGLFPDDPYEIWEPAPQRPAQAQQTPSERKSTPPVYDEVYDKATQAMDGDDLSADEDITIDNPPPTEARDFTIPEVADFTFSTFKAWAELIWGMEAAPRKIAQALGPGKVDAYKQVKDYVDYRPVAQDCVAVWEKE